MIKQKDLDIHTHIGRQCVGFSYTLKDEDLKDEDNKVLKADFTATDYQGGKIGDRPKEWRMQIVLDRTRDADSQVYKFDYVMPRNNLPLELIAATGLKFFQLYLKEEVQSKINIDFTLGEKLEGM